MCAINYDTWHVHLTHPIQALNNLTCLTTSQRYWQPHRIFSLHRNTECETGPIGWKRHNFRNCTYWHKRYVYICIHSYRHTHTFICIYICVYIYIEIYITIFLGGTTSSLHQEFNKGRAYHAFSGTVVGVATEVKSFVQRFARSLKVGKYWSKIVATHP